MLDEGFRWLNYNKEGECKPKEFYGVPRVSSEYADCSMPLTFDQYNYCLSGDTSILVKDRKSGRRTISKQIKDIIVGDEVVCYEKVWKGLRQPFSKVTEIMKRDVSEYFRVSVKGIENPLLITGEHPVFISRKHQKFWCPVNCLQEGDLVLTIKPLSMESQAKISKGNKGKIISEHQRKLISISNIGRKASKETCAKR